MLEKARDALPFAIDLIAARRKNETVPTLLANPPVFSVSRIAFLRHSFENYSSSLHGKRDNRGDEK